MMKKIYLYIEIWFEKITAATINILGNSITFLVAVLVVVFWLTGKQFAAQNLHDKIGNVVMAFTFLTLFTIQKEFKRFAASLHIKLNELISANEAANNKMMIVEEKTESELLELTRMYAENVAQQEAPIPDRTTLS